MFDLRTYTFQGIPRMMAATCAVLSLHCSWGQTPVERLRLENIRLRAQVDSLQRQVRALRDAAAIDLWEGLSGIERDDAFEEYSDGFGLGGLKVSPEMTERLRRCVPCITLPYTETLGKYLDFYSGTKRSSMASVLGRYDRYASLFAETFRRYGVPEELAGLSIVESAVSPRALSKAGAYGAWQLMPETARQYGLRVDDYVDERADMKKATEAAARYLSGAYNSLGSWGLAVLSYNCGVGAVRKAIVKAGGSKDLWKVMEFLPDETQGYLPSLFAARNVLVNRDEFGIKARPYKVPRTESVTVSMQTTLGDIARKAGLDEKLLLDLNPKYAGGRIPAGENEILLPEGYAQRLRRAAEGKEN